MKNFFKIIIVVLITLAVADSAHSIPAFARKYNFSCNVCHFVTPKLKPFGEEFAGNGFQIPDKEPARFFRNTGDPTLLLMRELPIGMRFDLTAQYENGRKANVDLRTPFILKFLSGGNIANDISYYFYYFISERGEMAGIEDAFVMFNDLFGEDLDIYIGQFQVSDPLFKRELRLTQEDYRVYTTKVGQSLATLKYERGLMFTYGLPTGTDFTFEIMNGNGIGTTEVFDVDKYKNYLLRISQEVTENFRIGGFGYYGKEKPNDFSNELVMLGGDFTVHSKNFELNTQYVYRQDDNPYFTSVVPDKEIKTHGGMVELILSPDFNDSKWFGTLLYNKVDSEFNELDYESYTAGLSYNLKRNLRIIGEYTYVKDTKTSKGTVGIIAGF